MIHASLIVNGLYSYNSFLCDRIKRFTIFAFHSPIRIHTHTLQWRQSCHARRQPDHWEQLGVQCPVQGHFDTWLSPGTQLTVRQQQCDSAAVNFSNLLKLLWLKFTAVLWIWPTLLRYHCTHLHLHIIILGISLILYSFFYCLFFHQPAQGMQMKMITWLNLAFLNHNDAN